MVWNDTRHRDGRHGHGSEQFPGREGVEQHFFATLQSGALDSRFKENELVLGVNETFGLWAFPLVEVWKDDFAVNVTSGEIPYSVLCLPGTHTVGAYYRSVDGRVVTLKRSGNNFVDSASGSVWDVEGRCVEGLFAGKRLQPLNFVTLEWHSWSAFHPETKVYVSQHRQLVQTIQDPILARAVEVIRQGKHAVDRQWPVPKAWLPESAISGVEVVVDGHPVRLFHFKGASGGEDWALCQRHSVGHGCLAAGSFPERLFSDPAQKQHLPEEEVKWAPIIEDGKMGEILAISGNQCQSPHPSSPGFCSFVEGLRAAGHRVTQMQYLLGHQLPVRAEVGFSLVIGRDRWMLLRFPSEKEAATQAEARGHCIQTDRFLLWSNPPAMYVAFQTITKPDNEVPWSAALEDDAFSALIRDIIKAPRSAGST